MTTERASILMRKSRCWCPRSCDSRQFASVGVCVLFLCVIYSCLPVSSVDERGTIQVLRADDFADDTRSDGASRVNSTRSSSSLSDDEPGDPSGITGNGSLPAGRSFVINGDVFLKDGKPFSYRAGTAHYWRRMPQYWEDTMVKLKAMGLNALETYISWNLHEPEPGQYEFEGPLDVLQYFRLAAKHDLLVIVRPGPFINAEVDMGGLPYWLLREKPSMKLRTSDVTYMRFVEKWFRKLLPMLGDLLYVKGGPIVLAQIENEYGSYFACDKEYTLALRDLARDLLGSDVVLYTTDGPSSHMISCGRVEDTLTTVDFGGGNNVSEILTSFREQVPTGPFVNSEFYPGWINHWGRPWNIVPPEPVMKTMKQLLETGASFTVYPTMGGTNFGFIVGTNIYSGEFVPGTTSYDFDAPLSEAGDPTEKFWKLQSVLRDFGVALGQQQPVASEKAAYGSVEMRFMGTIFDNLLKISPGSPTRSSRPLPFEQLRHPYGFVLYRTVMTGKSPFKSPFLSFDAMHDRGYVFVDQIPMGLVARSRKTNQLALSHNGDTLDVLVQNEGRVTAGPRINDSKGIIGNVWLEDKTRLEVWDHYPIQLPSYPAGNHRPLSFNASSSVYPEENYVPSFFEGRFLSSPPLDTFLKLDGWRQGYAFVNGHNLGRYWPTRGPQLTLFVPGAMLRRVEENVLQLFELEKAPCMSGGRCSVKFVSAPVIGQSTIYYHRKINF